MQWPTAWHLVCLAEDKCRFEHFKPAEIEDRVRHRSRPARSADVGCGVSLVSHFLEGSGGRRVLLGRQRSAPSDELAGTWKQRCPPKHASIRLRRPRSLAVRRRSLQKRRLPLGAVSTWGQGTSSKARVRRNKRETVNSTTKRGEERREHATLSTKPGRNCVSVGIFGGGDVWRACCRKPLPSGQSSQMYNVPVRQAPGKTVSTVLTRQGEGRDQDSRAGDQIQDSCPSLSSCARRRILDVSALLFGASRVRTGRGCFRSRSSSWYQGQDHQNGISASAASICWQMNVSRQIFWLPRTDSRARFRPGGPPPVRDRQHMRGRPSNSRAQQLEAEKGDYARHAIGSYGTRHPVWGEEAGTAMHCDTRESSGSGCRPVPECLVVACVRRHRHGTRRQVCNSQHLLFCPPHWLEQRWIGFSSGSRDMLLQSPTCAFDQYNQSICNFVPTTAL